MKREHWPQKFGFGLVSLLAVLVLGMLLGALLYSIWTTENDNGKQLPQEKGRSHLEHRESKERAGVVTLSHEAQKNSGVDIEAAVLRSMQTALAATGAVAADQTRIAHIRPLARGLVEKVYVRLGDRITKGDPLIEYDNIELGLAIGEYLSAEAELERSLTNLDVKRKILARSREMLEVGAVARTVHDIREAEYRDAEATVRSRRAIVSKIEEQIHRFGLSDEDLRNLRGEDKGLLHRTDSHNLLRSPFYGVITSYDVAEGELVEPSDQLMTVTDISQVWVLADVYEKDLAHVQVGKSVDVRVASYSNEVFLGKITYISDLIEPSTRTAKVRCVVPNRKNKLKLDMFATIEIPTGNAAEALSVPSAAIQQVEGQSVVFVQLSDTEFRMQPVEIGIENRGWVEVQSGLRPGQPVVAAGSFYLKSALLRDLIGGEE